MKIPAIDEPRVIHLDKAINALDLTPEGARAGIAASELFMRAVLEGKRQFELPQLVQAFSDWLSLYEENHQTKGVRDGNP